jgi:hypothetical protein
MWPINKGTIWALLWFGGIIMGCIGVGFYDGNWNPITIFGIGMCVAAWTLGDPNV